MKRLNAFSLVEVVVALGIFAFCVLAILGLLSQGLSTDRVSGQEQEAASIVRQLSASIENAQTTNSINYTSLPPLTNSWSPTVTNSAVQGTIGNYSYWVKLSPGSGTNNGSRLVDARIEVAWPAQSVQWNTAGKPSKAAGSFSSRQFFFAR